MRICLELSGELEKRFWEGGGASVDDGVGQEMQQLVVSSKVGNTFNRLDVFI